MDQRVGEIPTARAVAVANLISWSPTATIAVPLPPTAPPPPTAPTPPTAPPLPTAPPPPTAPTLPTIPPAPTPSPPPRISYSEYVISHRTPVGCVPVGASADLTWVHKLSFMILVIHLVALFFRTPSLAWWTHAPHALDWVAAVAYLGGIISSTVALCATTKSTYRICSVLYIGVGILDLAALPALDEFIVVLLHLNMLGGLCSFVGGVWALEAIKNWGTNRSGDPENPPTLLRETHGCCAPVGASANVMMVYKLSFVILLTHIAALLLWPVAPMGCYAFTVSMAEVVTYIVVVISSTAVLCCPFKLSYHVHATVYAVVGILEAIAFFVRCRCTFAEYAALEIAEAAVKAVCSVSCFTGSIMAFKVICTWDSNRS